MTRRCLAASPRACAPRAITERHGEPLQQRGEPVAVGRAQGADEALLVRDVLGEDLLHQPLFSSECKRLVRPPLITISSALKAVGVMRYGEPVRRRAARTSNSPAVTPLAAKTSCHH
jgi:hypothetical protein